MWAEFFCQPGADLEWFITGGSSAQGSGWWIWSLKEENLRLRA